LIKRGDDTEEKLKARLSEFHNKTSPVLEYYNDKVANINADADLDLITEKIRQALN
jgi:adenylate kinase